MPTLDALQAELGGPGFEVLVLSLDRQGASAVQAFFQEIGIEHLVSMSMTPAWRAIN